MAAGRPGKLAADGLPPAPHTSWSSGPGKSGYLQNRLKMQGCLAQAHGAKQLFIFGLSRF